MGRSRDDTCPPDGRLARQTSTAPTDAPQTPAYAGRSRSARLAAPLPRCSSAAVVSRTLARVLLVAHATVCARPLRLLLTAWADSHLTHEAGIVPDGAMLRGLAVRVD